MKKKLLTIAMLVVMTTGAMMLSAFATQEQEVKTDYSQIQMNDSPWKEFRQNVAYCDGDTDKCMGTGSVWINTDTYQTKFVITGANNTPDKGGGFDLTEYKSKEGYNYRFWYPGYKKYFYVYINISFY